MTKKLLSEVVIDALQFHAGSTSPSLNLNQNESLFVFGSGNALPTGKVIFANYPAIFSDETNFKETIRKFPNTKKCVVVSASGEKHAPIMIDFLLNKSYDVHLITCSRRSSSADITPRKNVFFCDFIDEPYTYNVSTYIGMMRFVDNMNLLSLSNYLSSEIAQFANYLEKSKSYYFILPDQMSAIAQMVVTKLDEIFGSTLCGRCYTLSQTVHAKTVISNTDELFISLGLNNNVIGTNKLNIPMKDYWSYIGFVSVAYYIVGCIQKFKGQKFFEYIESYKNQHENIIHRSQEIEFI